MLPYRGRARTEVIKKGKNELAKGQIDIEIELDNGVTQKISFKNINPLTQVNINRYEYAESNKEFEKEFGL